MQHGLKGARAVADDERRTERRQDVRWDAWLSARGYGAARVTMVDVSPGGAQVTAPLGLRVRDRVTLSRDSYGIRSARVQWIEAERVGLEFLGPVKVA